MIKSRHDLFYTEKGWPWHYDPVGKYKNYPMGKGWNLIAEDEDCLKLNFFTGYYIPMRLNFDCHLSDVYNNPSVDTIKKLWYEFEVFMAALMEQIASTQDIIEFLRGYETPNLTSDIYPYIDMIGYKPKLKSVNHQWLSEKNKNHIKHTDNNISILLNKYDIKYWNQLSKYTKDTVRLFWGIGNKRIEIIESEMNKRGLKFKE